LSLLASSQKEVAAFDRKLESVKEGLQPYISNYFKILGITNGTILADYIIATRSESNISDNYRKEIIKDLFKLSEFFNHQKSFEEMIRDDLLLYLNSLRKPEPLDPLHKWIRTYNLGLGIFQSFFKWLHYPDIERKHRQKPPIIKNISKLKRKEVSTYKPTDLWTPEDSQMITSKKKIVKRSKLVNI
jgi:site-specific recombinase XerD